MMADSKIEWSDTTWNPFCGRRNATGGTDPSIDFGILMEPVGWKEPRVIPIPFDPFYDWASDEMINEVFAMMDGASQHKFCVLTSRTERMRQYCTSTPRNHWMNVATSVGIVLTRGSEPMAPTVASTRMREYCEGSSGDDWMDLAISMGRLATSVSRRDYPLPNVWLGVSVQDQSDADTRIPDLLATPAALRFVSYEPALGPLDLTCWLRIGRRCSYCRPFFSPICPWCGEIGGWRGSHPFNRRQNPDSDVASGIDWVICRGESGYGARPMHPDWARGVRDQCAAASVPFSFEWGDWAEEVVRPIAKGARDGVAGTIEPVNDDFCLGGLSDPRQLVGIKRVGKRAAGRLLDGVEHNAKPEPR